ncbi:MAG TPA: ABC transporter ATP-binding protein [Candidatus Ruthenibacterium avium]|uniref:ABC transporter ATP-binding protein n=1 Tax=Candidatus Ruthenibacterium avium TaxID=2838751 RepID=A0A9D2M3K1_9FIRM|nr:ABC transporter ATP-binding protein [Candidatus Ruthenibacterium avium]
MENNILVCEGLTKNYGRKNALNNVTLTLPAGRMVGLLGPNGSGKTTFLKLIAGFLTPSQGTVQVCGEMPGVLTKRMVSYLPDRLALEKYQRVFHILHFYEDFFDDFNSEKAMHMLEDLEIEPRQRLSSMSKGMLEKVQLILTMSREAKLYLLDEPLGGVDPAARDYILNTILRNYNEDSTVIFSTHLISDVEKILDDAIFLKEGTVQMYKSVDEIRTECSKSLDELFREVFQCSKSF